MQAYSLDFRQKIVSAYERGGATIVEVGARFEVSPSFIKKMLAQKRATGGVTPIGQRGGQPKRLTDKHRQWLLKTVLAQPDITLGALQQQVAAKQKLVVSVATLCRELQRLNLRRKKNQWWLVSETRENVPGTGAE